MSQNQATGERPERDEKINKVYQNTRWRPTKKKRRNKKESTEIVVKNRRQRLYYFVRRLSGILMCDCDTNIYEASAQKPRTGEDVHRWVVGVSSVCHYCHALDVKRKSLPVANECFGPYDTEILQWCATTLKPKRSAHSFSINSCTLIVGIHLVIRDCVAPW